VRDEAAAQFDVDNLRVALAGVPVADAFLTAASPGVISLFFHNDHYPSHEAYLFAIADAMRHEYETVTKAGLVLQVDCPDLGMGRHIQFADLGLAEFRTMARLHVEALNHALAGVPAEQVRLHVCWGNYEGPHHHDVPLADIIDIVFAARATAVSFEAANPRHAHEWKLFERVKLPKDKVLIPGVLDSSTNYIEHPAARRPRERHRGHGLWVRHVGGPGRRRSARGVGEAGEHGGGRASRLAGVLVGLGTAAPGVPGREAFTRSARSSARPPAPGAPALRSPRSFPT
jgi:hypothetical protein